MQINITVDDALIAEAMRVSGAVTKEAAIEQGLQSIVDHARRIAAFDELAGIGWEGDLNAMRSDRPP